MPANRQDEAHRLASSASSRCDARELADYLVDAVTTITHARFGGTLIEHELMFADLRNEVGEIIRVLVRERLLGGR
jgi:hypothetical protein